MKYRNYDPKKDRDNAFRILNECGWVHDIKKNKYLNDYLPKANSIVLELNNEVEVIVNSIIGSMRYLDSKLTLSAVTGVNASFLARKKGYGSRLNATRLALDAQNGADIGALTIFDQGFYNQIGFGNGGYENIIHFTPAKLDIPVKPKTPIRFTDKDFKKIHKSRARRLSCHGGVTLPEITTYSEMGKPEKSICLGFQDEEGNITHHVCLYGKGKEAGPLWVSWMAYQNLEQLMDLLALLKSFEEQILMIRMFEPPFINMQDFINKPFLTKRMTRKSEFQNYISTGSFWQFRILNLESCIEKTHLNCDNLSFNLQLSDPISKYLAGNVKWHGLTGDYKVTLGQNSIAKKGTQKDLPTLKASVGAFTRLWFGILPASALVYSDGVEAPDELLKKLDNTLKLPVAHIDWGF
ncbi:MAG: GNAT family N-acetyltransferase [Candidatus Cloacimonetes bacterium]|nr:GNAT family N-acetyltransferase [Candidatus Cloacimonadota bacterium]